MKNRIKLKTQISKAYYCTPELNFEEAKYLRNSNDLKAQEAISWLDDLFQGGILLPDAHEKNGGITYEKRRPLTFLITGPPGSGKSTLALETCYRLTRNTQINNEGLFTLYISTEADAGQIKENAESFGWNEVTSRVLSFQDSMPQAPAVAIWGTDNIQGNSLLSEIVKDALLFLGAWLIKSDTGGSVMKNWIKKLFPKGDTQRGVEKVVPDILVIDSLNVLEPENRSTFFKDFLNLGLYGPKIIFFILDSGATATEHEPWEFACDNVIRLDYTHTHDYYLRSIEIIKARYQSHTWGRHQLKIYPPFDLKKAKNENEEKKIRWAHPYREEGGICIFPSIHKYLSNYKRMGPTETPESVETKIDSLNEILNGGFYEGRCTALIGDRGGHKSYLGYIHLISRIVDAGENGLVISLRDDEGTTRRTINKILRQEFSKKDFTNDESKRLEVLYYPPGNITPEEFFHRMYMSIYRLQKNEENLTILFNSLDQLGARFPLCAKEEIFVPGLIECFTGERITSIFVAVEEPGQPAQHYGLLPMADIILSFEHQRFPFKYYYQNLASYWEFDSREDCDELKDILKRNKGSFHDTVLLHVKRFAGGQRAGKKGFLELVDENENEILQKLYKQSGLNFTPLDPKIGWKKNKFYKIP